MTALTETILTERKVVDSILDVLPVTDIVYHDLRHTQPLVEELLRAIRRRCPSGRILIVAPNATLPHALLRLGYEVDLWPVPDSTLDGDLKASVRRTGSLDELVGRHDPNPLYDVIVIPFVLEATLEHPTAVLSNLSGWLRPGGEILVASAQSGALENRLRGLAGVAIVADRTLAKPGISFSWPAIRPQRTFGPAELRAWCLEAGFRLDWQSHVLDKRAAQSSYGRSISSWLMALARHHLKAAVPGLRDCLVAALVRHPIQIRKPPENAGGNEYPSVTVLAACSDAEGGQRLLADICGQTYPLDKVEVLLIHHGPNGPVPMAPRSLKVRWLESDGQYGPKAANTAVAASTGEILAFTDDHCHLPASWIEAGVAGITAWTVGTTGEVAAELGSQPFFLGLPGVVATRGDRGLFSLSNSFYRKDAVLEAGVFDESYQRNGRVGWGWDSRLAYKLMRLGYRVGFDNSVFVFRHFPIASGLKWIADDYRRASEIPAAVKDSPAMAARFLRYRVFASRQTLYFDLMVAGASLAILRRKRWFALLGLPWLAAAVHYFDFWPPAAFRSSVSRTTEMTARQAVWLAGLIVGSLKSRRVVL